MYVGDLMWPLLGTVIILYAHILGSYQNNNLSYEKYAQVESKPTIAYQSLGINKTPPC